MNRLFDRPRLLGFVCAASAVGLGIVYLALAGAPERYVLVNLASFAVGAAIWFGLGTRVVSRWNGGAVLALTVLLVATALFGVAVEGATRWVSVGPLSLQISLVVLPAIIVLYARNPDAIGTVGVLIAAVALTIQPDRAMAGVLAAGIGVIVVMRRSPLGAIALVGAVVAFAVTMVLPDTLPGVPFVEGVLYTAFDAHLLAGVAVVTGCIILLIPALGAVRRGLERPVLSAFGASWAAVIAAAAIGNYPTPLVGYGASAVLGYLLSVALLAGSDRHGLRNAAGERRKPSVGAHDPGTAEMSNTGRG